MALNRLAASLASRRIRTHSLAATTRSLSTSTSSFSSSSFSAAGEEDGAETAAEAAAAEAAEGLAGAAATGACSSSSSSLLFLLPDASAPVAAAASMLDSIGPNSSFLISLPWWAAIPTAAVAVRAALLPLSVAQARSAAAFGPLMQRAREEEGLAAAAEAAEAEAEAEAEASKNEADDSTGKGRQQRQQQQQQPQKARRPPPTAAALLRRVLRLREQTQSPHPRWLLLSPLLQLPVFASAVLGVRAMANAGWPGFGEGGALWFPDLTARAIEVVSSSVAAAAASSPASSSSEAAAAAAAAASSSSLSSLASLTAPMGVAGGLLPALVAAGTLAAAASAFRSAGAAAAAAAGGGGKPPPSQQAIRLLLEWLALPAFAGSLLLPQGAVLYWASSSGAALAQGAALRSGRMRELLGLRQVAERAAAARGGGAGGGGVSGSSSAGEEAAANALLSSSSSSFSSSSSSSSSSTTPPAALAHLSRAAELRAAGDVDGAIRAASAAVALSRGQGAARAWFALGQLRATAAHWHDAELAFGECARLEGAAEEGARSSSEGTEDGAFRSRRHEVARALFGAGVAQSMQGDSEAASDTLRRAVAAAEEACGGAAAVEAEADRRKRKRRTKKSSAKPLPPLPPPLATLARSLLALASSLDAQEGGKGKTEEALAVARRAAGLDEGAERMAVAPLVEKLRKEREAKRGEGGGM